MLNLFTPPCSHIPEREGWCGMVPYFEIKTIVSDGIGRQHAFLESKCAKCSEVFTVGIVHLPTVGYDKFRYLDEQIKLSKQQLETHSGGLVTAS